MRTLITIIILATANTFCAESLTTTGDTSMNEVNQLVQSLIRQYPWPPNDSIMITKFLQSERFVQLKELAQTHWDSLSRNWDSVVGGDTGNAMLLYAFQDLDADSYMTVLERLAEKLHQNKISKSTMRNAFSLPDGRMQKFLVDNYRHIRIQILLKSLKPYFDDDANTRKWIREILSGKAKREWNAFEKAHKGTLNIPQVLLDETNVSHSVTPKQVVGYAFLASIPIGILLAWRYFRKRRKN